MGRYLIIFFVLTTLISCVKKQEFSVEKAETSDSTEVRNIKVTLPVVSDKSSKSVDLCKKVNSDLKTFTDEVVAEFDIDATSFYNEFVKDAENPSSARYELVTGFDSFYADLKTISLRYFIYQYTAGAHGMTRYFSYVYDVDTSKRLSFSDLFKTDSESLNKLNALLKKNFKNPEGCFDQDPEVAKDFTRFNVMKDSVTFTFEQYELGAYACGVALINVPIVELKKEGLYLR